MIRHVFKLIWNRKRANALILAELLVSFLVLAVVATSAAWFVDLWRQPIGYRIDDVWRVEIDVPRFWDLPEDERAPIHDSVQRLYEAVRQMPAVRTAALATNTPYLNSGTLTSMTIGSPSNQVPILWSEVSPELRQVLEIEVTRGRWFEAADAAQAWTPLVIDARLAGMLFGAEDPIGQRLPAYDDSGQRRPHTAEDEDYRIVGVIPGYRRGGELERPMAAAFLPAPRQGRSVSRQIVLKLRPGAPADFEEQLVRTLRAQRPDWTYNVTSVAQARSRALRSQVLPLLVATIVAGFLLVMVGMGLMGVLWQNVARRTRELGLRRAVGATGRSVMLQILGELVALTTLAALGGIALYVQGPLLGLARHVGPHVHAAGLAAAVLILYYLVVLCGLYPSWLATRVHPAQALQYE
jgi:putative ABC transport system permease protein